MSDPHEVPSTIGPYEVEAFLGETSTGPVYRVRRSSSTEVFSLKVLPADLVDGNERAERELSKLTQLHHPCIAQVRDVELRADPPYIVVEYIKGSTLRELIRERRLSFAEAFRVFHQVCQALDAAHGSGLMHRTLNPSTIMVSPDLQVVRVIDFAVGALESGRVDVRSAGTDLMRGMNLGYRAPETLRDGIGSSGARADVFAAGVVFYELLTGKRPGSSLSLPSTQNSDVPPDLDPLVLRCIAARPEERYDGFAQILAELRTLDDRLRLGLAHNLQGLSRRTGKILATGSGRRLPSFGVLVAAALFVGALLVLVVGQCAGSAEVPSPPSPQVEEASPAEPPPTAPAEAPAAEDANAE
jgi:serine/threonine-protein kinase